MNRLIEFLLNKFNFYFCPANLALKYQTWQKSHKYLFKTSASSEAPKKVNIEADFCHIKYSFVAKLWNLGFWSVTFIVSEANTHSSDYDLACGDFLNEDKLWLRCLLLSPCWRLGFWSVKWIEASKVFLKLVHKGWIIILHVAAYWLMTNFDYVA